MTLEQAAQAALDVQNAVNLSGVVRAFAEVTEVLWTEARRQGQGTEWVNTHPIVTVFLDKLLDLNHRGDFFEHYRDVQQLARYGGHGVALSPSERKSIGEGLANAP